MKAKLILMLSIAVAAPRAHGEELSVYAAVSLTDVLAEIGRAYEAATGNSVAFNLGASSDLARQIQAGAPADVFFSADAAQVDGLQRAGLVRASQRIDVLSNVLVGVVPADSAATVAAPADLLRLRRIALADPQAVPAGVYARRYLESLGLWARLKDAVVPALNVRAALAAVESANADAGLVYRTDAAASKRVRVAFEVPRDKGPQIVYVLAPLASSKKASLAGLVQHLTSPGTRRTYERHGFIVIAGQ